MQILATLGAAAIVFGSVLALRQARLKLLVAYSTVAQIGYLFLMFPLARAPAPMAGMGAWTGGILQAISHACAKAAMFMAAGLIAQALGHDRIAGLGGIGRALPMTVLRVRARRAVADGPAAERRLRREMAAADARRSTAASGGGRW